MQSDKEHLNKVLDDFTFNTLFFPVMAAEIEFYLNTEPEDSFFDKYLNLASDNNIDTSPIEEEKGDNQFEIKINKTNNILKLASDICLVKELLKDLCKDEITFAAKPYDNNPPSGMHIHISLNDSDGNNIFTKDENDKESDLLIYSVGGLLDEMQKSMLIFAPLDTDKARYRPIKCGENPTTISWGGNNRTVALRLPTTTLEPENRRIEHRVPCADANPFLVIATILESIEHGITNKIKPNHEKIYGNAIDEQYECVRLDNKY